MSTILKKLQRLPILRNSQLWRNRNLRFLALAQTVSTLGDQVYRVALVWFAYQIGGVGTLSIIFTCQTTAFLVIILLSSSLTKSFNPRSLLITSDLSRGVIIVVQGVMIYFHVATVLWLSLLAILFGLADAMFRPAYSAVLKIDIDEEAYAEGLGIIAMGRQLCNLIGPVIGGFLLTINVALSFWINATSFFISAGCIFVVRRKTTTQEQIVQHYSPQQEKRIMKSSIKYIFVEMKKSFAYIRCRRWLVLGLGMTAIISFVQQGMSLIGVPSFILSILNSPYLYALSISGYALGAFAGSFVFIGLQHRKNLASVAFFMVMVAYFMYGALGFFYNRLNLWGYIIAITSVSFIVGVLMQAYGIAWETHMMMETEQEHVSEVSGIAWFLNSIATPIGVTCISFSIRVFGVQPTVIAAPWLVALLCLFTFLRLRYYDS